MNKAGWVVAVLIGIVTAGIAVELQRARVQWAEEIAQAAEASEMHAAEVEVLEARIRELQARASSVSMPAEEPAFDTAAVETAPDSTAASDEPEEESEEQRAEREREERIVGAQLGIVMDMAYGPFYEQMELPDELKAGMRDVLVRAAHREQQNTQEAFRSKDKKASEIKAFNDESDARLKQELARVLAPEQTKAWEAYEPYAEQILYENLLDGQLAMLSPGLTEDARRTTKEQFARGLKVALDEFHESDETYTLDNFNDAQLAGLRLGMEKLSVELDAEQQGHAGSFITQVEAVFNAMDEGQP